LIVTISLLHQKNVSNVKKPLEGLCLKVKDKPYHENCFSCSTCGVKLTSTSPSLHVRFSSPYCGTCYAKLKPSNQPAAAGSPVTTVNYGPKMQGFTVDPKTGQKKMR